MRRLVIADHTIALSPERPTAASAPSGSATSCTAHQQLSSALSDGSLASAIADPMGNMLEDDIILTRAQEAALEEVARRRSAWDRMSQHAGLENLDSGIINFRLHSSHRAIECGGYVGCIACGSLVSRQRKHQRMEKPCVPHPGPKVSGSLCRINRAAQGIHPYANDAPWPNGSVRPAPRRVSMTQVT